MAYIIWIIVTLLLAAATIFSAIGKFRKIPQVVDMLHHVGVTDRQIPWLGAAGLAAGFALVLGVLFVPILAFIAAAALAIYYLGAAIAHWRVGDKFPVPPLVLFLLSLVSLLIWLV